MKYLTVKFQCLEYFSISCYKKKKKKDKRKKFKLSVNILVGGFLCILDQIKHTQL